MPSVIIADSNNDLNTISFADIGADAKQHSCDSETFISIKSNAGLYIKANPNIKDENTLRNYISDRIETLKILSEKLKPEQKVNVVITPREKLSPNGYIEIVKTSLIEPTQVTYSSTIGGGGFGAEGERIYPDKEEIDELEKRYNKILKEGGRLDENQSFKLIENISIIRGKITPNNAIDLQLNPKILLVDAGPNAVVDAYLNGNELNIQQRDIFDDYQRIKNKLKTEIENPLTKSELFNLIDETSQECSTVRLEKIIDPPDCDAGWRPDYDDIDPIETYLEDNQKLRLYQRFKWDNTDPLSGKCSFNCDDESEICCADPTVHMDRWYFHEIMRDPTSDNLWDFDTTRPWYSTLPGPVPQPEVEESYMLCFLSCPGECLEGQLYCDEELEIYTKDAHEIVGGQWYDVDIPFKKNTYGTCRNTQIISDAEYNCLCQSSPPQGTCFISMSNCDGCGYKSCDSTWDHKITLGNQAYCGLFNDASEGWYQVNSGGTSKMLIVDLDVPLGANFNLYVYKTCGGSAICGPENGIGQDEHCAIDTSVHGTEWYYLRVYRYSGSGSFTLSTDWKYLNGQYCTSDSQCYSNHCSSDYDGSGSWCCDSSDCAHDGACYDSGYSSCYGNTKEYCSSGAWSPTTCSTDSTDSDGGNYPKIGGYCEDFTGCSGGDCGFSIYRDYCSANFLFERYDAGADCGTYSGKNCDDYDEFICSGNDSYLRNYYCYDVTNDYCNYSDQFQETCNTGCNEGGDGGRYDYQSQGWVLDYTGCSAGSCQNEGYKYDYCSGTNLRFPIKR